MKNLQKIRLQKNMNQLSLAMKLDVAQETISAYENGKSYPSVATLLKMCDIFDASADFLLDRTDVRYSADAVNLQKLSPEETELIKTFRTLGRNNQNAVLNLTIGLGNTEDR